jgi:hypothetical protein
MEEQFASPPLGPFTLSQISTDMTPRLLILVKDVSLYSGIDNCMARFGLFHQLELSKFAR